MPSIRIEMDYYTYAYLREDKTPYYIGKGIGNRIYSTHKRIKPPKDKSRIIFLKQNLTEEEAFKHEIYMIAVFGRKDLGTGILGNRTNGGEGASGWVPSEETRRKMSESSKNPSEETRRKISEANKGKTCNEETRKKLSEASKGNKIWLGKKHTEETKKKISEKNKGKPAPNKGIPHSEETKIKLSIAAKNRKSQSGLKAKQYKFTHIDGKITISTIPEMCRLFGYQPTGLRELKYNKRNYHKDIIKVEEL